MIVKARRMLFMTRKWLNNLSRTPLHSTMLMQLTQYFFSFLHKNPVTVTSYLNNWIDWSLKRLNDWLRGVPLVTKQTPGNWVFCDFFPKHHILFTDYLLGPRSAGLGSHAGEDDRSWYYKHSISFSALVATSASKHGRGPTYGNPSRAEGFTTAGNARLGQCWAPVGFAERPCCHTA